jgi:beta-glucanase (GH16 family)
MISRFLPFVAFFCLIQVSVTGQKLRKKVVIVDTIKMDRRPFVKVFGDEFDGESLDTSKWYTFYPYGTPTAKDSCSFCRTHVVNNVYLDENCVVKDGKLHLITKADTMTWFGRKMEHTSGLIYSKQNFNTYGRYEIRCKLPEGNRQSPAFWLFGWNAEIDVFEFLCEGPEKVVLSVHNWQSNNCKNKKKIKKGSPCYTDASGTRDFGIDFSKDFHVFAVEYSEYLIKFFIDDQMVRYIPKYFDMQRRPVSEGKIKPGKFFVYDVFPTPGEPLTVIANQGVCWPFDKMTSRFPNSMEIDYIRVYQRK